MLTGKQLETGFWAARLDSHSPRISHEMTATNTTHTAALAYAGTFLFRLVWACSRYQPVMGRSETAMKPVFLIYANPKTTRNRETNISGQKRRGASKSPAI